jgi:hypothetical protein
LSGFNPTPKSDNPYAAPLSAQAYNPNGPYGSGYPPHDSFPQQVPVIGILMMVQGGLELAMGLLLLVIAGFLPIAIAMDQRAAPGDPPVWIIGVVYGIFGLAISTIGILRMFAGYGAFRFRRRMFAIIANCLGFGTLLTCYCAPTALALGVYSLIVLLQPSVMHAFAQNVPAQSKGTRPQ